MGSGFGGYIVKSKYQAGYYQRNKEKLQMKSRDY